MGKCLRWEYGMESIRSEFAFVRMGGRESGGEAASERLLQSTWQVGGWVPRWDGGCSPEFLAFFCRVRLAPCIPLQAHHPSKKPPFSPPPTPLTSGATEFCTKTFATCSGKKSSNWKYQVKDKKSNKIYFFWNNFFYLSWNFFSNGKVYPF